MLVKCQFCGSYISDTKPVCKNCGATNNNMTRNGKKVPQTIEELKLWCESKKMPLEKMRFFIGINCKDPRCFGIYKDTYGNFIVYKNKSDGSRSIRYEGTDEAYAVNEIYMKLKEEILNQKSLGNIKLNKYDQVVMQPKYSKNRSKRKSKSQNLSSVFAVVFVCMILSIVFVESLFPLIGRLLSGIETSNEIYTKSYYSYEDDYYFHSSDDNWYLFDEKDYDWDSIDTPVWSETSDTYQSSYYDFTSEYDSSYSYSSDTDYYTTYSPSNDSDDDWDDDWDDDDWDSSYDYDYSSWDSGSTDWDSDW